MNRGARVVCLSVYLRVHTSAAAARSRPALHAGVAAPRPIAAAAELQQLLRAAHALVREGLGGTTRFCDCPAPFPGVVA